ncbi:MAG: GAF domain-containing protein [Chloroflexi bacterium]|nr:GAF domain-containing protein [Chloroflexota bacterium]
MEKSKNQSHSEILVTLSNHLDLAGKGLNTVLTLLTATVARTINVDQVSIWQFKNKSLEIWCINMHNHLEIAKPYSSIDLTPNKTYLLSLQTEQAIACSDITPDKRVADLPATFWVDPMIKSCLHLPVRIMNQVVAILRLDSRNIHEWVEADIHFCAHVAALVGQVLLSNELVIKNQRSLALRSLSTDLIHRYELPKVLSDVVRKSVEVLDGSSGTLYLAEPDRRLIYTAAGYNSSLEQNNMMFRFGENVAGKVAETGQELLIKDYRSWTGRTEVLKKNEPFTTILCLPLHARGELLGVLQITRIDGNQPFTEADHDTVRWFANLACLAIEQSRLVNSNHRLRQFQDSMKHIVETTTFASSVVDFLETVTDYLTQALTIPLAAIHIEDTFTYRGFPDDAVLKKVEGVLYKRGKRFNPVTVVHDVSVSDAGYRELAGVMESLNVKAYILVPIPMNHERVGYVCIASESPRTWEADEKQMVEIAAYQIGLAIEGIRFYQETQSQTDIIKRMTSITSSLNRLVAMDDLIPMIGEGALRLCNANGLALIFHEQNEILRTPWVFGVSKTDFSEVINSDGKELLRMFTAVSEPMLITNIAKSALPKQVKNYLITAGIRAVSLAPIIYSGNVIGLIAAFHEMIVDWPPRDRQMMTAYTNTVALALQNSKSYEQLERGYMDIAISLADSVEARESQLKTGNRQLAEWTQQTAELIGLHREDQEILHWAALLHDIGKVEIPNEVIQKPGPLSPEEKLKLEHYPLKSEKLLSSLSSFQKVGAVLRGIREHYDGNGYPDKRKGDDIPLAARILSVVDAYSSMIDHRSYRPALSHEAAIKEIMQNSGKQFDPQVVNAFLQAVANQSHFVN